MPITTPSYNKVTVPKQQSIASAEYLEKYESQDPTVLELETVNLLNNIVWGAEHTADQAEETVKQLGFFLGFHASRPEKELNDGGPDVLWAMSRSKYAIIELKTEVHRPDKRIIKEEAEQLTHSATAWFPQKYQQKEGGLPVLIHPSNQLDKQAHLPQGSRIITEDQLEKLKRDVTNYINEFLSRRAWKKYDEIQQLLRKNHLSSDQIIENHSVQAQSM